MISVASIAVAAPWVGRVVQDAMGIGHYQPWR